jgi:hypothetical protein
MYLQESICLFAYWQNYLHAKLLALRALDPSKKFNARPTARTPAPPLHPSQLCVENTSPVTAPRNADYFSGSFACRFNDWQRRARRFQVGQSHSELITQAGYTTAGYFLSANTAIILLLLFVGSPHTTS